MTPEEIQQLLTVDTSDMKALIVRGDFTDGELSELISLLRRMDHRRPDGKIAIFMVDPKLALDAAKKLMFPDEEGRQTDWYKLKRP